MSTAVTRVQAAVAALAGQASVLRRKCDCGGSEHECEECKKKSLLQRKAAAAAAPARAPRIVHEVLGTPGLVLDQPTQAYMEARFGHDFSQVRVHAGARAAESARVVRAKAYTVGQHIVMGAGLPSSATPEGRTLLAHELTHTLQQAGAPAAPVPGSLVIGPAHDLDEREADAAARQVTSGGPATPAPSRRGGQLVQRVVKVTPPSEATDVLSHFNHWCPGQFTATPGGQIQVVKGACTVSSNLSCECACDTATDSKRTYTIDVQPAAGTSTPQTLHDGSTAAVPDTSVYPHTDLADAVNPVVSMAASSGSSVEFGFFGPRGRPVWYDKWRILAHELCGHGRLNQSYAGSKGCRAGHDVTIDTENSIAAEHGGAPRGHFADPRQGEAFWNPVGDRSKVAFRQCNGLHYEAP